MQVYTAYTVKPPTDYFVYTPSMPSPHTRSNNEVWWPLCLPPDSNCLRGPNPGRQK